MAPGIEEILARTMEVVSTALSDEAGLVQPATLFFDKDYDLLTVLDLHAIQDDHQAIITVSREIGKKVEATAAVLVMKVKLLELVDEPVLFNALAKKKLINLDTEQPDRWNDSILVYWEDQGEAGHSIYRFVSNGSDLVRVEAADSIEKMPWVFPLLQEKAA